ncbi:hypothetical protein [Streptomyces sp. NPDC048481]|uniref:hypothetical protein n=1 Tax=Streptomyces sp. NPDC048481 TaxID=3365557 RepID=UPI003721985C
MTSSQPRRGRPRRTGSHLSVRVAHTVVGGTVGIVWLVLPGMTSDAGVPVAIKDPAPAASTAPATVTADGGRSTVDLVLPLVAVGAAGAAAGYGYIRRVRRTRDRTTPGGTGHPASPQPVRPAPSSQSSQTSQSAPSAPRPAALDERACAALVAADDRIRAARGELGFAAELFAAQDTARFRRTLDEAAAELAAAFRMRQCYDEGVPAQEAAREHALAGIIGRCEEVQGLLDSAAGEFEGLRAPGRASGEALVVAEGRFRELTGRVGTAEAVLAGLRARYAHIATDGVVGNVEQARDRLLFATDRLNRARQAADAGRPERAARHLGAAEGVIAQAAVLLEGVDRLAGELAAAERAAPAALAAAQEHLSRARAAEAAREGAGNGRADGNADGVPRGAGEEEATRADAGAGTGTGRRVIVAPPDASPGELHARLLHADAVLASIRRRLPDRPAPDGPPAVRPDGVAGPDRGTDAGPDQGEARGPDPVAARSGAVGEDPDPAGAGWDPVGELRRIVRAAVSLGPEPDEALRAAALLTARSAVGCAADFVETHRGAVGVTARTRLAEARRLLATGDAADRPSADDLAGEARELAELDVRAHGNPYAGPDHTAGVGGAVLGGVVPAGNPDGGRPAGFAGPARPAADG